jgi:hypothetical protein
MRWYMRFGGRVSFIDVPLDNLGEEADKGDVVIEDVPGDGIAGDSG